MSHFAPSSVVVTGILDITVADFTYEGGDFDFTSGRFNLTVTNHAAFVGGQTTLRDGARLHLSTKTMAVGGNLTLSGTGTAFHVQAQGPTNALGPDYALLVDVPGSIIVGNGAVLYPRSDPVLGGSPLFRARNAIVEEGGVIDALGTGFAGGTGTSTPNALGKGPSGGNYDYDAGGGGAHGGQGGTRRHGGQHQPITYDSEERPYQAGSGGGSGYGAYRGGAGGGVIRIEARSRIQVDGTMTARGQNEQGGMRHAGGGAGGTIYLRCSTFAGAGTGKLIADGGNCGGPPDTSDQGGAGGGGRIAVWRVRHQYTGTATADAGLGGYVVSGQMAGKGTVFWGDIPPSGTRFIMR